MAAEFDQFSLKDLIAPTGNRLCKQLSAVANFSRYREWCEPDYNRMVEEHERSEYELIDLENEVEQATKTAEKLRITNAKIDPEIKSLEQETSAMTTKLNENSLAQNKYQQDISRLKNDNAVVQHELVNHQQQLKAVQQECDKYRSQIVHNPEELKIRIANLREQVEQLRKQISQKENFITVVNKESENVRKIEKETQRAVKTLSEYDKEKQRLKQMQKDLHDKRKLMEDLDDDCSRLHVNRQHLERQIQNVQEKTDRYRKQHNQKQETNGQAISDVKREKLLTMKRVDKMQNNINVGREANERLRQDGEQLIRQHKAEMTDMKRQYDKLDTTIRNFHKKIQDRTPLLSFN